MELFIAILIYFGANVLYVGLNTITAIFKVKSGKLISAISSAVCYGFYVYVLVLTAGSGNLPTWAKALLTAITNLIGVWLSMFILEKTRKDKLWEITATIKGTHFEELLDNLEKTDLSYNYNKIASGEFVFNFYSHNKKESALIKKLLDSVSAKYIVHEQGVRL